MTDELIERLARLHRHYESGGMGGEHAAKILRDAIARIMADAKIIKAADELAMVVDGFMDEYGHDSLYENLAAYRAAVSERIT